MTRPVTPGRRWSSIREARRIILRLIRDYQVQGGPFNECECNAKDGCRKCRSIDRALETIAQRLETHLANPKLRMDARL